jgi:hypothetical protein
MDFNGHSDFYQNFPPGSVLQPNLLIKISSIADA